MPELPEVENVVIVLQDLLLLRKIKKIEVKKPFLIKSFFTSQDEFSRSLEGQTVREIKRKGKYIFFILDDLSLIFHLRMTGKFLTEESFSENHLTSLALIFFFEDNSKIFFCDSRNFATIHLQKKSEYEKIYPYTRIGTDLLNDKIDFEKVCSEFTKRKIFIKSALLEQNVISGIGNIYASEILFFSKISPFRMTNLISKEEYEKIFLNSKIIINKAVEMKGCSIVDFLNPLGESGSYQKELRVYGKSGSKCKNCENLIEKSYIEGRSTFFCSKCQI